MPPALCQGIYLHNASDPGPRVKYTECALTNDAYLHMWRDASDDDRPMTLTNSCFISKYLSTN